jgi:penicillin-binding protein 1C
MLDWLENLSQRNMFNISKKFLLQTLVILTVIIISFRVTPFLFPITEADIRKENFNSVKFYDRHGELLQEVLSENSNRSVHVNLNKISPYFIQAIIAAEDKNFYAHNGIDYAAVIRAFWQNVRSGKIISGASTITLQLARLLSPGNRTIFKKLHEAFIAYRIEAGMDKHTILQAYINRLPMGGNLYGIESAAKAYFGSSASDLTLAQATLLAAIPNSPNKLNPYFNKGGIKKRQREILERLTALNFISYTRINGVLKEDVLLKPQNSSFLAPHFVSHLMKSLPDSINTVQTTIDKQYQKLVSEQIIGVLNRLKQSHVTNACAILLDNYTGEVLAYVGSANYFNTNIAGQNDGILALRQPGSTLKPFLYLLAMEHGFHPATIIPDIPTHYSMPDGIYSPKNYSKDFHGPVRLREALANSLNIPAVRTLTKIGTDPFLKRLHQYEFNSLNKDAEYYGVGLTLGGGEVTLYELTRAYLCLARMGDFIPLREILKLNESNVKTLSSKKQISLPELNFLVGDILNDNFARTSEFGFNSVLNLPFHCSVKTGTSFHFCDNWTVGFTKDYTLGIWVGNFDHTPMLKVSGVSGAGPLFANIMYLLYEKKKYPENLPIPDNLIKIRICPLSGKIPGPNCSVTIEELIPKTHYKNIKNQICDMHVKHADDQTTSISVKYKIWAEPLGYKIIKSTNNKTLFQIVNPTNGEEFMRLPNLSPRFQSIRFQLNCSNEIEKVNWFLNGSLINTTFKNHEFLWQVTPGEHTLLATSDYNKKQWIDQITFFVK